MTFDLESYVGVDERIRTFAEKHPTGCLRPLDPAKPYEVVTIGDKTGFVVVVAAYRTPDDPTPGVGMAWEEFPGKTQFTRDSELQNAETSAWGRALVAVLAADTKRGIASRQEVEARRVESPPAARGQQQAPKDAPPAEPATDAQRGVIVDLLAKLPLATKLACEATLANTAGAKWLDDLTAPQAVKTLRWLKSKHDAVAADAAAAEKAPVPA